MRHHHDEGSGDMTVPLRLLVVEDYEDDAQLVLHEIKRGGYEIVYQRVETREALRDALANRTWDLILCDYSLPGLNAIDALSELKASGLDLPFIIISGTIAEESAVTAMKEGAHDFMVKGNLARLLPAIERELKEVQTRRERRRAEDAV